MPSDKPGQPTKYKSEYCQWLIEHMATGLSFHSFAKVAKVDQDTLFEWAKVHPEFSEAKKAAFEENRYFWEMKGINGMEQRPDRPVLNPTIYIFNMKNRFPKEWRDRHEIEAKVETKTEHSISPELQGLKDMLIKVLTEKK